MGDNTTIEVDGYTFEVTYETDNDAGKPWDQGDGNGRVRSSDHAHWQGEGVSDKKPGERPLNTARGRDIQYYYDKLISHYGYEKTNHDRPSLEADNRLQKCERTVKVEWKSLPF